MTEPATTRPRRRRRLPHSVVVLLALTLVGGAYAMLAPRGQAAPAQGAANGAITQGRNLFNVNCASCHGFNAVGGQRAPSLIGVGAAAVDFQVSTGRMPLMAHSAEAPRKKPAFTEAQIRDLAAYVASLAPGPAIPGSLNWQGANSAEGGQLFRENCSQCHNVVGSGGALTSGKFAPALNQASPTQIWEAIVTGPENMPVFSQQLSTAEKLDVIKYLMTIRRQPNPGGLGIGRVGPVTEGLVAWLVGIGLCVLLTMWIGQRASK